jgi:hypothetical protein
MTFRKFRIMEGSRVLEPGVKLAAGYLSEGERSRCRSSTSGA